MSGMELMEKIKQIPLKYQEEVEDFINFLLEKKINKPQSSTDRSALLGIFRGKLKMADNFDDPIEGMEEYMP